MAPLRKIQWPRKSKSTTRFLRRFPMAETPNLPRDILFDILSHLPTKPLLRFRRVAKPWLSLITHPHFIHLHLAQSIANPSTDDDFLLIYHESIDYTKQFYSLCTFADGGKTLIEHKKFEFPFNSVNGYVRIVGSSHGLVCLVDTNFFSYFGGISLWNPVVGKFKNLPDAHITHRFRDTFSHMVVGFGFVLGRNNGFFKVVLILYDYDSVDIPDVLVYSLEGNCWRKVEAIAPCYMPNRWSSNVYVYGAVHWMAYRRPRAGSLCDSIMSFDMGDEVFRVMALPNNLGVGYDQVNLSVSAYGESLSLFVHFGDWWEVWLMKDYGVVDSWMKQFSIAEAQISLPLKFTDAGDVLLVKNSGNLVSCDPEDQQMKDLGICGLPSSFHAVTYTSSLVLLDGGDKILD